VRKQAVIELAVAGHLLKNLVAYGKGPAGNAVNSLARRTNIGKQYLENRLGTAFARGYHGRANASGALGASMEPITNTFMSNSEMAHTLGGKVQKAFGTPSAHDMVLAHHLSTGNVAKAQKVLDRHRDTRVKLEHLVGGKVDLGSPHVKGGVKDVLDHISSRDREVQRRLKERVETALPLSGAKKEGARSVGHAVSNGLVNGLPWGVMRGVQEASKHLPSLSEKVQGAVGKMLPKSEKAFKQNKVTDLARNALGTGIGADYSNFVKSIRAKS
jgi:hypothetical protein